MFAQLELHEGRRRFPYTDTAGKLTIGVGHNLTDKGLSHAAIEFILNEDVDEAVADLASFPWFAGLDPVRQRVMVDLRFNLGPNRFRDFKKMLRAMERGVYPEAANRLRESVWFTQVGVRGVRLMDMLRTGEDFT